MLGQEKVKQDDPRDKEPTKESERVSFCKKKGRRERKTE